MFARNAGAYTSEVPFRLSTLGKAPGLTHKHKTNPERLVGKAPGLTHKHKTKPERLVRDKHFSLFSPFVSCVGKMLVHATQCRVN